MKDLPRGIFVALAALVPIAFWIAHRELGHHADIAFFHEWYLAFRASDAFYRDGPGSNYPILGVLIVCGPSFAIEKVLGGPLELAAFTQVLKGTLVLGEIAFILAASSLARALEVARPHLTALALYAIPMTWACGAYFGQTDVWGSALLLASASALIAYRRSGALRWLAAGLFALMLALLAKQLTWFAAPALIALAIAGIARHRDRRAYAIAIASPLVLLVVDPFLTLPDGFRSHVAFVIARGSGHGELAVASGASLWSLFVPGGTPAAQLRWLGVSSFAWGWILWAAIILISAIAIARRPSVRHLVLGAGLAQLAMATLLTGVHERYLVHAVPLVLVASRERWLRILGAVVGIVSGVFVLSTLHDLPAALARPEPLALLALAWLGATLAMLVTDRAGTEPRSR